MKTGIIAEQILEGETGTIHYSYYLPEDYDTQKKYPLMMVMPGYDMMWRRIFRFEPGLGWVPMLDAASGGYDRCVCSADGLA